MPEQPSVGVHLPSNVPGVDGATVVRWARTAEALGFSSIGVAERFAYATLDAVVALAAAAGATNRIRLVADILIPPLRSPAIFAKEMATLSVLAPGRLDIGVAAGARPQDYAQAGVAWDGRGHAVDASLAALDQLRQPEDFPESLGPVPVGPQILVGGASKGALSRMVRWGHGYISGGITPQIFSYEVQAVTNAWAAAGREGSPRIIAGTWAASDERYHDADAWRDAYLARGGPPEFVRAPISRGADEVRAVVAAYGAEGATEVVLFPGVVDIEELEWLAEAVKDHLEPV